LKTERKTAFQMLISH